MRTSTRSWGRKANHFCLLSPWSISDSMSPASEFYAFWGEKGTSELVDSWQELLPRPHCPTTPPVPATHSLLLTICFERLRHHFIFFLVSQSSLWRPEHMWFTWGGLSASLGVGRAQWPRWRSCVRGLHRSCDARESSEVLMVLLSGHERDRPRDQAFRSLQWPVTGGGVSPGRGNMAKEALCIHRQFLGAHLRAVSTNIPAAEML